MALPIKTTMEDVDKIVAYLKTKPAGATLADARSVMDVKALDARKISAYKTWGLVTQSGDKYSLSDVGRRISRDPASKPDVLRGVIDQIRPYRGAIEWAFHQSFDVLTVDELAAHWHQHNSDSLGTEAESSIKDAVTCFFNVADGAGLGKYVLGRRGTETRLELVKDAVKDFVEAGPSVPPWTGAITEEPEQVPEGAGESEEAPEVETEQAETHEDVPPSRSGSERLRVFIAHGQNMRVVEQVQTMLELANIDAEVAEEEESTAIPVPNKVLTAMRRSGAGIICVNADESRKNDDGKYTINENVLIEIGAAFVLYDTRVILLWDKRLPVPSNLQGLYRCEFEGDEIGWDAGMKLMKALSKFR